MNGGHQSFVGLPCRYYVFPCLLVGPIWLFLFYSTSGYAIIQKRLCEAFHTMGNGMECQKRLQGV